MTEESLFELALKTPEAERAVLLDRACEGNPELRQRVEALLRADVASSPLSKQSPALDATTGFKATVSNPPLDLNGVVIAGRYKLVEPIGEGGMGMVWVAQQSEPVKRLVALKLIKAGMDSKAVLARFDAERQALAMMDHPNIAKVLDGGLTEERRPYFVMELVKGTPITTFCDERKLSLQERLALFIPVCQAIQHAHQKGIIHRDIKPSNVLIALYDEKPVPKVIDFGVAKATGAQLTDQTLNTGFGAIVGTPEYMSPEQASLNNLDIDTRSDVYALGVLLYELLTGSTPVDRKSLKQAALMEVLRIIREDEPPRPSTRLSTTQALPSIAANRHVEPAKLSSLMKGELDWIVMKALEKDRSRRYETANGFAADVMRYLSGEQVIAVPPSWWYRCQKFSFRHRGAIVASILLMVGCLIFIASLYTQVNRASVAEIIAKESAEAERRARDDANTRRIEAEANLRYARKANEILGSIFVDLRPARMVESGRSLQDLLKEQLKKAVKDLDGTVISDAVMVADMQMILGISLLHLGESELAITIFTRARETYAARLGMDHSKTLESLNRKAEAYRDHGKPELAQSLFEELLKTRTSKLGPHHLDTLSTKNNLAICLHVNGKLDLAIPIYEEVLRIRKAILGENHLSTLASMNNLAGAYGDAGKFKQSLALFEDALKQISVKQSADHPDTLIIEDRMANALLSAGKLQQAINMFEQTLQRRRKTLGVDHPHTLISQFGLAKGYLNTGKLVQALPLMEEAHQKMLVRLGPDHPDTLASMGGMAEAYRMNKKLEQALPLYKKTLSLMSAQQGFDHPHTLTIMSNLALCYQEMGLLKEALQLHEETLVRLKAKHGMEHPKTLMAMNNLGGAYWSTKQFDRAIRMFETLLSIQEKVFGRDHVNTQRTLANLGVNYKESRQWDKALPLLEEAYGLRNRYPFLGGFANILLECYIHAQNTEKAILVIKDMVARERSAQAVESFAFAAVLANSAMDLLAVNAFVEAELYLRECLAIREKIEHNDWRTFNTLSMLGGALLGQKKYTEAEPMLLKGYEGMQQRAATISPQGANRLPAALDRLIQLYTETNKPNEVKKWQAEKDRISKTPDKK